MVSRMPGGMIKMEILNIFGLAATLAFTLANAGLIRIAWKIIYFVIVILLRLFH